MTSPEALIHGDLHTGSIMVTESETRVIDPEFAFYGPMGFDLGAVIGNLIMSYLASAGHERSPGERRAFETWVLETIENVWSGSPANLSSFGATEALATPIRRRFSPVRPARRGSRPNGRLYMERLFQDTVGFSAAKIIRRILGLAHNIDFEWIEDPRVRAVCEARSLRLARAMMVDTPSFRTIGAVTEGGARIARLAAGFRLDERQAAIRRSIRRVPAPAIAAHRR